MEGVARKKTNNKSAASWATNLAVAGTIFASSLASSVMVAPPPVANADVELSTGAIIVQTSTKEGQTLLKTEIDAKDLFTTAFKNRKELKESLGRISDAVKAEVNAPVWKELSKEFLQFEGDVAPDIKLAPPRDVQQTIKDIYQGKLNFIVNGEIINISVEDKFSKSQDEIVLRVKGVKGIDLPTLADTPAGQAKTRLQEQIEAVDRFWETPVHLPAGIQETLPEGTVITNGNLIVSGATAFIGGSYAISYTYYVSQQQAAEQEAAARRKMIESRKKKGADIAATKKAKEEEQEEDENENES